jgi:hypothetical protein
MKEKVLFVAVGLLLILNISNYFEIKKLNVEFTIFESREHSQLPPRLERFYFDGKKWVRFDFNEKFYQKLRNSGKKTFARSQKSKYYYYSDINKNWIEIERNSYFAKKNQGDKVIEDYNDDILATYFLWDKLNNKWLEISVGDYDKYYKLDSIVRFEI